MGRIWAATALVLLVAACGGDETAGVDAVDVTVAVPDGADFCSIFSGEYDEALGNAVPVTDEAFTERTAVIVVWAEALATLAPDEIADEAQDNLDYHRAQAAIESAAEFIPGSNAMHEWARSNC
jgi:hypothetical protein